MRKGLILFLSAFAVLCLPVAGTYLAATHYNPNSMTDPEALQNVVVRVLLEDVQAAVDDYYSEYTDYLPTVEAYAPKSSTKVVGIRFDADENLYEVTIEVQPYVTAHNTIGQDRITFLIDGSGSAEVAKFEHIKSFEYPPWLNQELKKPFPIDVQ